MRENTCRRAIIGETCKELLCGILTRFEEGTLLHMQVGENTEDKHVQLVEWDVGPGACEKDDATGNCHVQPEDLGRMHTHAYRAIIHHADTSVLHHVQKGR